MPKLANVQELEEMRQAVQESRRNQLQTGTAIFIGMGTCGIAAGARETMTAIQQELARRKIDAHIGSVGCIGMCVKEPLLSIQQAGGPQIFYGNVKAEHVPRLIEEHLVKGQPVKEWVIGRLQVD